MEPHILAVSKIDAEQRTYPAARDVAKIFPTIHHLISARLSSIARRCNCRTNAIQLKENVASSLFEDEHALLSCDYGLDGESPGGIETLRLNLRDRTVVSIHGQGES